MTTREAYYVLDHVEAYGADTVDYARRIVAEYERQGGSRHA